MPEDYDFRRVSPTALIPAFARGAFTDIPWAREMLDILRSRGATLSGTPWPEERAREYAPLFEARFRAVSRVVEEKGVQQVLELAGGFSPRGMELARRGTVYVEADLEESTNMKRELVTAMLGLIPENLHLCAANVLDRQQLLACCEPFDRARPVAVTAEGLLRYLTFEEKKRLAQNVLEILQRYGGWWITPDVHLSSWALRHAPADREAERERLGRDLAPNYFTDLDHAHRFFEECGFVVESRPILEGIRDAITGPQIEERAAELEEYRLFVLTAAG